MVDKRKDVGAEPPISQGLILDEFLSGATTKEEAAQKLTDVGLTVEQAAALLTTKISDQAAQTRQITFDNDLRILNLLEPKRNFPDQLKALLGLDASGTSLPVEKTTQDAVLKDPSLAHDPERLANKLVNDTLDANPDLKKVSNISNIQIIQAAAAEQAAAMVAKVNSGNHAGYERYSKVAYCDKLSNAVVENPEGRVDLANLVRYADDGDGEKSEGDSPVFVIDAMVWIQGVEVSEFIKGSLTISLNGTDGSNTASFTLDNSNDQFVWSERNLAKFYGASAIRAGASWVFDLMQSQKDAFVELAEATDGTSRIELTPEVLSTFAFTGGEQIKSEIFAYKSDPKLNPPIRNPKNSICFAKFDLSPNRCIFSRMDPVRIFTLYPFRVPGKQYETGNRYELWCPEFVGYIDNVAIDDDDIRGVSNITIDCTDIRESVLNRMRTATQVSSLLNEPLSAALGFATGPVSQPGNPTPATAQTQALQGELKDNTEGYYDINNTAFYDDVSVNVYNQPGSHKSLEEAVYDYLVGKEPITKATNNRGVRGVSYGGNFYYNSMTKGNTGISQARQFLEDWHKFCLFGPKRRPWTREEAEEVGKGTTTDGEYSPNKIRLWFMLPSAGTGAKNLADLSSASNSMTHEQNWTSRLEIVRNFVGILDYNFMVTPTGDLVVEFGMSDFRPEDFGAFKPTFRINKGLISSQIGDEQSSPPSGLSVQIGWGDGGAATSDLATSGLGTVYVYSPYIAARYGIETVTESIPSILRKDRKIGQQRAVMMYQKLLSRCHVLTMSFSYRPFLLPNRTLHHLRRSRMGAIVSIEKTITLGSEPKGEISVGLDHVRLFTGYYRSRSDLESPTYNEIQREDVRQKGMDPSNFDDMFGIDPTVSSDPIELQVFTTVAAGESTPSSARVGYSETSVLAPASGIYVLDLEDARHRAAEAAANSVETNHEPAPQIGDTTSALPVTDPPVLDKFRWNPIQEPLPLHVVSPYGPRKDRNTGVVKQHNGVDLRTLPTGIVPLRAVEDAIVRDAKMEGSGGFTVTLRTSNNYEVKYLHMDSSQPTVQPGPGLIAGGTVIGYSDNTGVTSGPHLHIQVKSLRTGKTVDITKMCPGPFEGHLTPYSPQKSNK